MKKDIQKAIHLAENGKELCEELMSLSSDISDLNDRFRYIRDDEIKHIGLLKILSQSVKD